MHQNNLSRFFPHALAGVLLAAMVAVAVYRLSSWRPCSAQLAPTPTVDAPFVRPEMTRAMKAAVMEAWLRRTHPELRVVRPEGSSGLVYVLDGDAEIPTVPAAEEYADCWRGAAVCTPDLSFQDRLGPHSRRLGDFELFGDVDLLDCLCPASGLVEAGRSGMSKAAVIPVLDVP